MKSANVTLLVLTVVSVNLVGYLFIEKGTAVGYSIITLIVYLSIVSEISENVIKNESFKTHLLFQRTTQKKYL